MNEKRSKEGTHTEQNRGARILARSLMRRLRAQGYTDEQIRAVAAELRRVA